MKHILTLFICATFISGCFVSREPVAGEWVIVEPVQTVVVKPVVVSEWGYCDWQPQPYPMSYAQFCDGNCCVWEFESYYELCEEAWCYDPECGWDFMYEDCYVIY